MEQFKNLGKEYFKNLDARKHQSRIYQPYQLIGLEIATLLDDNAHKALYIRMAKQYQDYTKLLGLAKRISEQDSVRNKGAYFMKLFFDKDYGETNIYTKR